MEIITYCALNLWTTDHLSWNDKLWISKLFHSSLLRQAGFNRLRLKVCVNRLPSPVALAAQSAICCHRFTRISLSWRRRSRRRCRRLGRRRPFWPQFARGSWPFGFGVSRFCLSHCGPRSTSRCLGPIKWNITPCFAKNSSCSFKIRCFRVYTKKYEEN